MLQVEIELEDENLLDVAVMTALFPSQKSFRFKQKQVGVSSATTLLAFLVVPHLVSNFEDLDFGRRQLEVTAGQLFFDSWWGIACRVGQLRRWPVQVHFHNEL